MSGNPMHDTLETAPATAAVRPAVQPALQPAVQLTAPLAQHPAPFVEDYLAYLLERASALLAAGFVREIRAAGISPSEWRILATLSDRRPRTVTDIAAIVLAKQPTVTRTLDRLCAAGHLQRSAGQTDRRHSLVSITGAGLALVEPLLDSARRHELQVLETLGESGERLLKQPLRALIAQLSSPARVNGERR